MLKYLMSDGMIIQSDDETTEESSGTFHDIGWVKCIDYLVAFSVLFGIVSIMFMLFKGPVKSNPPPPPTRFEATVPSAAAPGARKDEFETFSQ